ncbi:hypothetical protein FACS1894186_3220 [Alphaproteobacteria bacterium]|nr:hypothetical protein FACS1894186_3220 [Alphaproteobacteria bacterium]
MTMDSVALCSKALVKVGALPIASLADQTAEAEVCASLYPLVRDALLSCHPWSFAVAQCRPEPDEDAEPLDGYAAAYALPEDFLRVLACGASGSPHRIAGGFLHAAGGSPVLTYLCRAPEAAWPPFFDRAVVAAMAAELALPIADSTSKATHLAAIADEELRRARFVDSSQSTAQALSSFPLVEVRS